MFYTRPFEKPFEERYKPPFSAVELPYTEFAVNLLSQMSEEADVNTLYLWRVCDSTGQTIGVLPDKASADQLASFFNHYVRIHSRGDNDVASAFRTKLMQVEFVRQQLSRMSENSRQRTLAETIMSVVSAADMLRQASNFIDSAGAGAPLENVRNLTEHLTKQITDVFRERLGVELLPPTGDNKNDG